VTGSPDIALEVLANPWALARRVAERLITLTAAEGRVFSVALSGGTTPRLLYEYLADPQCRDRLPWSRIHWFWGDERFVPHDDARSNYHMVQEAMLSRVPAPAANIHAIPTEGLTPEAAAAVYERDLRAFHETERGGSNSPLFDVVLLGLGTDGHTASLFPGSSALEERNHWVAAVTDAGNTARITLTYPALENVGHAAFLVTGAEKETILARLKHGDTALPAARFRPASGTLQVFADLAAAGQGAAVTR
jgi:6-phosphogluconolactonase